MSLGRCSLLCVLLLGSACVAPPLRASLGPSLVPNIGVQGSVDWPAGHWGASEVRYDVHVVEQFLDDEDFAGDGNPGAGNWSQAGVGLRMLSPIEERRQWNSYAGLEWFRARGKPNIVDLPGDYLGLRFGFGFQTILSERFSLGPEISLLVAEGEGDFVLVPQLTWSVYLR